MSVVHDAGCSVEFLDQGEAEEVLDRVAREKMGISIAEFRRRAANGDFQGIDWDSIPGLVDVAILEGIER